MNPTYFRKIRLPLTIKAKIIWSLSRFIKAQAEDILRGNKFDKQFITESIDFSRIENLDRSDENLEEHVGRLFWVSYELGFLQLEHPYPHAVTLYRQTRAGKMMASVPRFVGVAIVEGAYLAAKVAGPVKQFSRVRNITTAISGAVLWWQNHEMSAAVIAMSVIAGVISTWIASFVTDAGSFD